MESLCLASAGTICRLPSNADHRARHSWSGRAHEVRISYGLAIRQSPQWRCPLPTRWSPYLNFSQVTDQRSPARAERMSRCPSGVN
jgi:hypothetical protein